MVNTSQQVGGSVGTALLSTIFAAAAASYASAHIHAAALTSAASIHGYTTAFQWAAAIFGIGLLVALLVLPTDGAARARTAHAEAHADLNISWNRLTRPATSPRQTTIPHQSQYKENL